MRRKIYITVFLFFISSFIKLSAQSLPSGSCGIVYTYDAAGNRIKMEYVYNNTTQADAPESDSIAVAKPFTQQALQVDVLYPNPTTGIFTIKMTQPLNNAQVTIMNVAGQIMQHTIANGSALQYNLSTYAAGLYLVHIVQGRQTITMKVLKH